MKGKDIYFVGVGDVQPWIKIHNHTIIDNLKKAGAKVTYLQDQFDVPAEVQNLNRAIAAKPDLIVLVPLDYNAIIPSLSRAQQAKIPVINLSSPPGPATDLFTKSIEGDHKALGEDAADGVIAEMKRRGQTTGNALIVTGPPSLTQVAVRQEGFEKKLAKALPDIKIVATKNGQYDTATSQKVAQQVFAQYSSKGGIQIVFAMSGNAATGILQAASQSGVKVGGDKGLIVGAGDCGATTLSEILAGNVAGSGQYAPSLVGDYTSDTIAKWLDGDSIPYRNFAPDELMTKANAKALLDKNVCA